MIRAVWVHQFNQLMEQTPEAVAATLLPRGIQYVYIKTHDGIYWMDQIYSHPMAPGAANFGALVDHFESVGVSLVPWVVPRGYAPIDEAAAHAQAAKHSAGSVIVDFEYQYPGFFDQGGMSQWHQYTDRLINSDQTDWVACAPDPRQVGREYTLDALKGYAAQLPQTYWAMFQRPWQPVLQQAHDALSPLGVSIEPIMDADGSAYDIGAAVAWSEAMGYEAVSMWRMGVADAAKLDAFGTTAIPQPEPTPEPQPPAETDWHAELISTLSYIKGPVNGQLRHYKSRHIKSVVAEIDRVCAQYGVV